MKNRVEMRMLLVVLCLFLAVVAKAQENIKVDDSRSLTYIDVTLRDNLAGFPAITIITDYGYLEKGDQVAYRVDGEKEALYIVTQKAFKLDEFCFELEFTDSDDKIAKKGGLEYIRINDYKYTFTDEERKEIALNSQI